MQHDWYDIKSFAGALISIFLMWMGNVTLQEFTTYMGIAAAATTIIYNVVKTVKEIKNKK